MQNLLLFPPLAFLFFFAVILVLALFSARFSFPVQKKSGGKYKSYACGEDISPHRLQPNYSQFFPYAYFFTIMHVVALMLTTMPAEGNVPVGAVLYILTAISGMFILLGKRD